MPDEQSYSTPKAASPVGAYPHARRVGSLLFLSGIGPREPKTNNIPGLELDANGNIMEYDIEAQVHSMFRNVKAVLEAAGAKWDQLVDITVFLTNMKDDFPIFNKLYADTFAGPDKPNPTRTTIEINGLPTPIAVELKVIAWCPG